MKINYPSGDVWNIDDKNEYYDNPRGKGSLDFSFINSTELKHIVKAYVWLRFKDNSLANTSIFRFMQDFKIINRFLTDININTLVVLTNNHIDFLLSYLNNYISQQTKKPLSRNSKRKVVSSLKSIVYFAEIHFPKQAPKGVIFTGIEYRNTNKNTIIEFIPDEVMKQIERNLEYEKDVLIRSSITILKDTGMRISELRSLKVGYLQKHPVNGWTLKWYETKKKKNARASSNQC